MSKKRALTKAEVVLNVFVVNFLRAILCFGLAPSVLFLVFLLFWGLGLVFTFVAVSLLVGAVAGLIVTIVTFSYHYPLQDSKRYRWVVSLVSAVVYAIGGLVSTAPLTAFLGADKYDKDSQQGANFYWGLITLAYKEIAHRDFFNVSGAVIMGFVGCYAGRSASKWYIDASKRGFMPLENDT